MTRDRNINIVSKDFSSLFNFLLMLLILQLYFVTYIKIKITYQVPGFHNMDIYSEKK